MQHLVIRPRWLILSAILVATLLGLSISTGMALGDTSPGGNRARGLGATDPGSCDQTGFGGPMLAGNVVADTLSAIAMALKLSPGELQRAISSGKTLDQIIASQGMTSQQVSDQIMSQLKDHLEQLVANARMTLSQESAMLASELARIDDVLSGKTPFTVQSGLMRDPVSGGFNGRQGSRGRFAACGG